MPARERPFRRLSRPAAAFSRQRLVGPSVYRCDMRASSCPWGRLAGGGGVCRHRYTPIRGPIHGVYRWAGRSSGPFPPTGMRAACALSARDWRPWQPQAPVRHAGRAASMALRSSRAGGLDPAGGLELVAHARAHPLALPVALDLVQPPVGDGDLALRHPRAADRENGQQFPPFAHRPRPRRGAGRPSTARRSVRRAIVVGSSSPKSCHSRSPPPASSGLSRDSRMR